MHRALVWNLAVLSCLLAGCTGGEDGHDPGASADGGARPLDGGEIGPDGASPDATVLGKLIDDAVHLTNPCGSGVTFCEQGQSLGIGGGLGYGRGVATVDLDGDGWIDIWRSESSHFGGEHPSESGAFRNMGDGTFERWDLGIAPEDLDKNWGGAFGDVDGDGDPDLFLVNGGYEGKSHCSLYRNDLAQEGRFVEITAEAGISQELLWWWGASFRDFDGDGKLDLVVTSRTGYSLTRDLDTVRLYRNLGDGTFEEVSNAVGLPDGQGDLKNPVWLDHDRDGDPDLLIPRYFPNLGYDDATGLFENLGGEAFVRVDPAVFPGLPPSEENFAFATAVADFDQDGWEDVYLGRWEDPDYIVHNKGDGNYELLGAEIGLVRPDGSNTMGLGVGDFTGDGYPDVLIGPGNPSSARPPVVFCSTPGGLRFERCEQDFREAIGEARWHGAAVFDLDRDLDKDVVWNLGGFAFEDQNTGNDTRDVLAIFVNHGSKRGFARFRLRGTESPALPLGASVRMTIDRTHRRTLRGAQGFMSTNSRWMLAPAHDGPSLDLRVRWPSGRLERFGIAAGRERTLYEGMGVPISLP